MNYEEALKLVPVKNGWYEESHVNDNLVVHYLDGRIHCEDGPAIFWDNGRQDWFQNDKLHRLDGPAKTYSNGTQFYYQNDQLHRLDGPAVICDEYQAYYQNGKAHRLDGPAWIYPNGDKEYWIDGKQLTEAEFDSRFAGNN